MWIRALVVAAVLLVGEAMAAPSLEITVAELAEVSGSDGSVDEALGGYHGKSVALRGFLHRDEDGFWALASQPSLHSCCIGDREKARLRVFIDSGLDEAYLSKVVTMEGRLIVEPKRNQEGELEQLYRLDEAVLVAPPVRQRSFMPYLLFGAVALASAGLILYRKRR